MRPLSQQSITRTTTTTTAGGCSVQQQQQQLTTNEVVTQRVVRASEPARLCIHVVVDVSGSMAGTRLEEAKQSVIEILNKIDEENIACHFRISTFNTAVTTLPLPGSVSGWGSYAKYKEQHRRNVTGMAASGGTNLYDAIAEALGAMKSQMEYLEPQQSKVKYYTFVLTDGGDTGSSVTPAALHEQLKYFGPKGYKLVVVSVTDQPDANLSAIKGHLTFVQLSNVAAAAGNIKKHFGQMIVQEIVQQVTRTVVTLRETHVGVTGQRLQIR